MRLDVVWMTVHHQPEAARSGVLVDSAGLLPSATATRDEVIHWTKRFMDLHRRTWPG